MGNLQYFVKQCEGGITPQKYCFLYKSTDHNGVVTYDLKLINPSNINEKFNDLFVFVDYSTQNGVIPIFMDTPVNNQISADVAKLLYPDSKYLHFKYKKD